MHGATYNSVAKWEIVTETEIRRRQVQNARTELLCRSVDAAQVLQSNSK
jgi:hypothetical protein